MEAPDDPPPLVVPGQTGEVVMAVPNTGVLEVCLCVRMCVLSSFHFGVRLASSLAYA